MCRNGEGRGRRGGRKPGGEGREGGGCLSTGAGEAARAVGVRSVPKKLTRPEKGPDGQYLCIATLLVRTGWQTKPTPRPSGSIRRHVRLHQLPDPFATGAPAHSSHEDAGTPPDMCSIIRRRPRPGMSATYASSPSRRARDVTGLGSCPGDHELCAAAARCASLQLGFEPLDPTAGQLEAPAPARRERSCDRNDVRGAGLEYVAIWHLGRSASPSPARHRSGLTT